MIWKELRQATPFCLKLWVVGLITVLLARISNDLKRLDDNWVAIIGLTLVAVAPLLVGVAAVRAERREGAFRLLSDHGVSPHGVTICKHLVWLLLSLTVFGILLFIDRDFVAGPTTAHREPHRCGTSPRRSLRLIPYDHCTGRGTWALPRRSARRRFSWCCSMPSAIFRNPHPRLSRSVFCFRNRATGAGFMLWALVLFLGIPFWWTVGAIPVICLAAAWVRTSRLAPRTKHVPGLGQSGGVCRGSSDRDVDRDRSFSHHGNSGDSRPGIGSRCGLGDDCRRGQARLPPSLRPRCRRRTARRHGRAKAKATAARGYSRMAGDLLRHARRSGSHGMRLR